MTNFSILDGLFIFGFVIFNLIAIFFIRKRPMTLREVAQGKDSDKLNDFTLISTIVATFCSGGLLVNGIEQTYLVGLKIIIFDLLLLVSVVLLIYFIIPKIARFKSLTLFETIGVFYNKNIRFVLAFGEFLADAGFFAIQLRLIGKAAQIAFGCSDDVCNVIMIIGAIVLIFYSAYGGLTAVAKTDVIQVCFFFFIIVFLMFWIFGCEKDHSGFINLFSGSNPKMQISPMFSSFDVSIATLSLWIKGLFPPLQTEFYQRIVVTQNKFRIMKIWGLALVFYGIIMFAIDAIGILLLGYTNGFNPQNNVPMLQNEILPYMVNNYYFAGIKGLIFVCIISLAMSTADSVLNKLSLLAANDILPRFSEKKFPRTCKTVVCTTLIIGFFSLILAIKNSDIFNLMMIASSLYMPVISVPLLLTILGLRTHKNAIWMGIILGTLVTCIYMFIAKYYNSPYYAYAFGPGMLVNFLGIIITHFYYFKIKKWKFEKELPLEFQYDDSLSKNMKKKIVHNLLEKFLQKLNKDFYLGKHNNFVEMLMEHTLLSQTRNIKEYIDYRNALYEYIIGIKWTNKETMINEHIKIIKYGIMPLFHEEVIAYCVANGIDFKKYK